ncbi:MAG: carboxypeptidase-like regulatory domain-containing protein, partial [bacterium]
GKPAPGIMVVAAVNISYFENKTVAKTTTDEDGNYKLTGLAAGRFIIFPLAKSYVVLKGSAYKGPGQEVNVAEGETIAKIDFPLVRGGVVTGRITAAEGHPIIAERVNIVLKDSNPDAGPQMGMLGGTRNQTDDRGVYRVYGLGPGNYKVSVGQAPSAGGAASIMGMGGSSYVKTFYPGVEDEARATIIEIKEGTEVSNVDITVGKREKGFSVSGRVIDADSGAPVASVYIGHSSVDQSNERLGGMNFTGNQTDANGKFRLEGLLPGRYAVSTFAGGQNNSTYSEPVTFDIADSDVTGIEIKLRQGATINGVAVMENNSDPAVAKLLQTVTVYAYINPKGLAAPTYGSGPIGPDGSFHIAGLGPGKARIGVRGFPLPPKGLSLVRTELDGLDQKEGIEVAAGAQVNGVRLLFAYGTGSVRGDVKFEGGVLPEGMTIHMIIRSPAGDSRRFYHATDLDTRLHFILEDIPPGNYELVVLGTTPMTDDKGLPPVEFLKQTVTVANGAEVKVNLVVDVSAKPGG